MIKSGLLTLMLFLGTVVMAQSFSPEPEQFLKQIDKYLSNFDRTKTKVFIEEFEILLSSNANKLF